MRLRFTAVILKMRARKMEESVIAELESPEKVAQSIKKNLGMEKENGSYGMPADQN